MGTDSAITLASLGQGDRLEGKVKKVSLSGAIVDVGAEVDGLLHVSDLGQKQVTRVSSILAEGQTVTVWVKRADPALARLTLTMLEPARLSWADLQPGFKTEGKVVRLEKFGAFVDIGAETDGLLHVSSMGARRVDQPSDVVSEGDTVTVWVKEADRKSKRISLSMVEPPTVDVRSLKPDMILVGKVVRLEGFGAFVDVGAGRDGMIHVTEMGQGYVESPSQVLSVGETVRVRVLEVDPQRRRISLSMKDLPEERPEPEAEEDEAPSSMELALRTAMERKDSVPHSEQRPARRNKRAKRQRDEIQDEIITRTLRGQQG